MDHGNHNGQQWQHENNQGGWQGGPPPINNPFEGQKSAQTAQTLGIIALVLSLIFFPPAGIVLGILAISRAGASKRLLGYDISEARVGRTCGIIAIVIGAISIVLNVLLSILILVFFNSFLI